jgi:hypothetical protein
MKRVNTDIFSQLESEKAEVFRENDKKLER